MTKIEQARQLLTKNPKISPADMSAEMNLPLKTVYLLRSQAKASLKKGGGKRKGPIQRFMEQNAKDRAAASQGWDDEPNETPSNYRVDKGLVYAHNVPDPQPQFGLPNKNDSITPLLAKMDRLREELADARAVIRYLEKRLEGKCS